MTVSKKKLIKSLEIPVYLKYVLISTAHVFKELFSITPQKKTFNLPVVSYEKSDKQLYLTVNQSIRIISHEYLSEKKRLC